MIAERTLLVLFLIAAAGGCPAPAGSGNDGGVDALDGGADATPMITYDPFTSKTWSLSTTGGAAQLSITDGGGPAACALSTDHAHSLGVAGVQIILQLPGTVTGTCPVGDFSLNMHCASALGSGAYVPAGCAYYRKFDAQGTPIGFAVAIQGLISIVGDATSCMIRASITFVGNSFVENFVLMNGDGVQPWCREG
jgi:hypothetical protein